MPATLTAPGVDARVSAFCAPGGAEVFGGVVHGNQIWTPDPLDVASIHAPAREAFSRLLARASAPDLPPTGKTLLLLGEAGSGKTHLMRAFRSEAHAHGTGYCAYLQLASRTDHYARYLLGYLIDSLNQPYRPGTSQTGLQRLAAGVLDSLDMVSPEEKAQLTDDAHIDDDTLARLVHRLAHFAVQCPRFGRIHVDLLRAALYLLSPDARVHALVMRWLRCEDLDRFDREILGDLVPRPQAEMPLRTICDIGRLMHVVHSAALVLMVDQMEEVVDASDLASAGETLRNVVNTLVAVADEVPNAVVVIGCLEDLFVKGRDHLPKPKLDRLERDPAPIRLSGKCTWDEVSEIVSRRLGVLFDDFDLDLDPANPLAPYTPEGLQPLTKLSSRDVIDNLGEHRRRCQSAGAWVEPDWSRAAPSVPPAQGKNWPQAWSDFKSAFRMAVVGEDKLAEVLAFSVQAVSAEMPAGVCFGCDADGRILAVDVTAGDAAEQLYVALCDKSTRGGGLGKQIVETAARVGDVPTAFVRSTEFPKDAKQKAATELAKLVAPRGTGRKVVVSDSDWRAMAAFRDFQTQHKTDPSFAAWQKADRPLASLPAVSAILALDRLLASRPPAAAVPSPQLPPVGVAKPLPVEPTTTGLLLGLSRGAVPTPIELKPKDMCRHAAFLGGPGSGKTTAALAVIEQLLLAGVPAVLLDRKGDLARYADPTAWAGTDERTTRLRKAVRVELYTPGAEAGRPLAIPVVPPDLGQLSSADREQNAQLAAASLGTMMGYKSRSPDPKLVILQKAIEVLARGPAVSVRALSQLVSDQDDALIGELDGFDSKHFTKLAQDLLTLSFQHRRLLEGTETLDVSALLRPADGQTRLTVVSTQFFGGDLAADFWVSQFLLAVDRWRAKNPAPDGHLQAVFLFDEADRYLPAMGQPSTKGPMEGLLKRARSAGLGLFLATQSPGDLDYRCRDQILTWLIGRVKEPVAINKLRPMLDRRPDAADKLANQSVGQFYLVRETDVTPIAVERNAVATEQLAEDRILELASNMRVVSATH